MTYQIFHDDNRNVYPRVGRVQAVITDPPYGEEVHQKEKTGRGADGMVVAKPIPFNVLTHLDIRTLADFCACHLDGWALIFSQAEHIDKWRQRMAHPTIVYNRPMIWVKPDAKPNFRGNGPGMGYETIQAYWCGTGKQRWNGGGRAGVFHHTRARGAEGEVRHPTGKPVSLMKELIRYFTDPGDTVFDPFMGCGATGVAALELGRHFIGVEKNREYYEEAERRLQAVTEPSLFMSEKKLPTLFGDAAFGSAGTRRRLEREARERENGNA